MRTTITLDSDVATRLTTLQRERGLSFKEAVNQTLRRGLGVDPSEAGAYRMPTRALGVRGDINIDRIRDVVSDLDDERVIRSGADEA